MSNIEEIYEICSKYSMISRERFVCNINSVKYIEEKNIPGCIVEIGVWKGGSILSMMMANKLYSNNIREFHLYDTFEGMTPCLDVDKDLNNVSAKELVDTNPFFRCIGHLSEVQDNIRRHIDIVPQYHKGDILKNTFIPKEIAILRLDTDWYESTKHELDTFYDSVVSGGVIIIDDYGHWQGCKKAVDEFLTLHPNIKLQTIDYTGVFFYKP